MALVRYWAAARDAAGTAEESYPDAPTLAELLHAVQDKHGERLARVVSISSLLVDEQPVGGRRHRDVPLEPDSVVEILPPFAGG